MLILMFNTWLIVRRYHLEGNIMSIKLIIFLGILFIITMGLTLFAFLQEDKKIKKYEEEGDTIADEIKRSREYESKSLHYHLPDRRATSELQSRGHLVCRLLLEKKKQ